MKITIYAGNAGDRNDRGMRGAVDLGSAIAERCGVPARTVAATVKPIEGGWAEQLQAAAPNLRLLAQRVVERLDAGEPMVITMGRCAASIATLPLVARRFPDAAIVYFDAHGDCNVPVEDRVTDYLGGMVISGAAGEWDTGFGQDVDLTNVILVGARDLDPPEQVRIDSGQIRLVPVGPRLGARLKNAIGGRRVYVHFDCDVLDAGLLATEYQVPGGLQWIDLLDAFEILAAHELLGLEITEYEASWPGGKPTDPSQLLSAMQPVLAVLQSRRFGNSSAESAPCPP
ncbi:arginase family protein [Lichenifustis flavocetrariae]|uniref:Arginase family protein n=1 Tax=Lichenifustis flavocetrariae TaxID=2949735 RepID=A0AA42CLC9_9HYPH|nr:arginase family protein [Lichenifustis flavocetrariae]MCW6511463.1 arginase family protein [Lichenifustis flavocetrariae]